MKTEIKETVKAFILKNIRQPTLEDNQDLFSTGLLSSLFAMKLVTFVESNFNLKIDNSELDIKNFRSVDAISHFVRNKMTS